jgi:hypothetical protein
MESRKRFLVGFSLAIVLLAQVSGSVAEQHPMDPRATHNMLVVGEKAIYLHHLPMFQEKGKPPMPHRYQVILEVTFGKQEDYVKDRREHRAMKIYTLNPEEFVLPELVSSDPQRKPLGSFKANRVFRGHLEKDGVSILEGVEVSVKRVIHFREFDPKAKKPLQLEYLLFGRGQELFLAHFITAPPPDFDQILAVKVADHEFTSEELAKGVQLLFPGTANAAASRLRENQRVAGEMKVDNAQAPKTIHVEVDREFYFEEGELQMPADFDTTPEEQRAGFP